MSTHTQKVSAKALIRAQLDAWDISRPKARAVKHGLYKAEDIDRVEQLYKDFLVEAAFSQTRIDVNGKWREMDNLWHVHLVYNRDYNRMCMEIAGRIIYHDPHNAPAGSKCASDCCTPDTKESFR